MDVAENYCIVKVKLLLHLRGFLLCVKEVSLERGILTVSGPSGLGKSLAVTEQI